MDRGESGLLFPKPEKTVKTKKKYTYRPKRKKPTLSVMQHNMSVCYRCGSRNKGGMDALEEHHAFEGNGKRTKSEEYGLKVYLCGCTCHREGPESAHKNSDYRSQLQKEAQTAFEKTHSREEFIKEFGKSVL